MADRPGGLTLVVGEALVDIVVSPDGTVREHPGGSPANVALGLARLGHAVELATYLGEDERGRLVREHLERDGVVLAAGSMAAPRTPTATATLDAAGVASYTFDLAWELPVEPAIDAATHLHTGSIATGLAPGAGQVMDLVNRARPAVTISYDANLRPALLGPPESERAGVERFVAAGDVVKASDEDLAWLYPGDGVDDVLRRWAAAGPAFVVATLGSAGARALIAGQLVSVPPRVVEVVDTVGAGDSFMAALISGLLDARLLGGTGARRALGSAGPDDVRPALERAIEVAAITCSRQGADPPYRSEL